MCKFLCFARTCHSCHMGSQAHCIIPHPGLWAKYSCMSLYVRCLGIILDILEGYYCGHIRLENELENKMYTHFQNHLRLSHWNERIIQTSWSYVCLCLRHVFTIIITYRWLLQRIPSNYSRNPINSKLPRNYHKRHFNPFSPRQISYCIIVIHRRRPLSDQGQILRYYLN